MTIAHGTILGGLSTVPDLERGIAAYRDTLGLDLVQTGEVSPAMAQMWGCGANVGSPIAVLRPKSGAPCWFRLIEQPSHEEFMPTRSYGWAAFETTVEDVWQWPGVLPRDLFTIVGPPKKLENIEPAFIPMQALGPGREMIYLNQVLGDLPDTDLPRAKSPVDRIFIVVLATPDRERSIAFYRDAIGLSRGNDYTLPYSMINDAFGLSADTQTTITMMNSRRMPVVEIDDYPAATVVRPRHDARLPPGNALVTLAVSDLDACHADWITPPAIATGPVYEGRRAACAIGAGGELIECVEVGD